MHAFILNTFFYQEQKKLFYLYTYSVSIWVGNFKLSTIGKKRRDTCNFKISFAFILDNHRYKDVLMTSFIFF